MLRSIWNRWFKDSETILLARVQSAIGFVVAVLSGLDWWPLINLASDGGFTQKQAVSLGLVLLAQGVVTEVARRARADDL